MQNQPSVPGVSALPPETGTADARADRKREQIERRSLRAENRAARRAAREEKRRHMPFRLCGAFRNYCIFLIFALIFTQALRSSLSAILFVYVLILPVFSLIYVIVARLTLHAALQNERKETGKGVPVTLRMSVENRSFLPLPFVEAYFMVPDDAAVRCRNRLAHLTLMPRSAYTYERTVAFPYCGEYLIGISEIFVHDPLRMFRIRVSMGLSERLFVSPLRYVMTPDGRNAISDTSTETASRLHGADRTELSDVRGYRMGDPMKNIHWKLSTKTEELQVKEYGINVGKSAYLFCDPVLHIDTASRQAKEKYADDIREFAADAVIGTAIAAAARELEDGNTCTLVWQDQRAEGGVRVQLLESKPDLEAVVREFATAPVVPGERSLTQLLSLIDDTQGVAVLFVTSALNDRLVQEMTDASAGLHQIGTNGAISLCHVDLTSKIADTETAQAYRAETELYTALLTGGGVRVYDAFSRITL